VGTVFKSENSKIPGNIIKRQHHLKAGACSSIVGWGTMLQTGRSWVWFPIRSLNFFYLPNPSSCTMDLEFIHPLAEMSSRNLPGVIKRSWRIRLKISPPCMRQLFIKCGIFDVSQPFRPLQPVTEMALLFTASENRSGKCHETLEL
jgi:hypothetical protein